LENLEDRLAPNTLSALGEVIGAATARAASTRPAGFTEDTSAAASAAVSRTSQDTLSEATADSTATAGVAAAAPARGRPLDAPAGQTAQAATTRAEAAGAAWDAGLIDLSTSADPSDEFAPFSPPRATPLGGGAGGALPGRGGSPIIASGAMRTPAPSSPPVPAFTGPSPGFGWSGPITGAPNRGTSPAPTPAPASQGAGSIPGSARQISLGGTTTLAPPVMGQPGASDALRFPTDPGGDASGGSGGGASAGRQAPPAAGAAVAPSNPGLLQSFDGLNSYDQRFANNGNQFHVVPPDQGLAVGNGKVLEVVNDVLRVYDTSGNALTGVEDLNTFFGYAAQFDRMTGAQGPFVTDPSAYFDQPTQRWFVDALTLEVYPDTGNYVGPNHIDIAVSQTADPTGAWNIYRTYVQDDGTDGTPNHGDANYSGPFYGDYPHIGADRNGIYITTNEYRLFGDGSFRAAQVYAFSKAALTSGASSVSVTQFDTVNANLDGYPGFTLIPSLTPGSSYAGGQGGTEYLLSSSFAPYENATGSASVLGLWTMTNTKSLNDPNPSPSLSYSVLNVNTYAFPPLANQKAGDFPLGQCLNDPTCSTEMFGSPDPYAPEFESALESLDTRMTQVTYANGRLWGALDTAVNVGGQTKAGIEWFVIKPNADGSGRVDNQGVLALANNNLIFPAIAVTPSGKGVMGFSVAGDDYYPSAGYASIDAKSGVGDIHIAANGVGPEDEFASYGFFLYDTPRFGDFGAAVADGNTIWVGNEYIANTGTLTQYMADPTLGGTRTLVTNWDTRMTQVKVQG
jgi:hypothetical protein